MSEAEGWRFIRQSLQAKGEWKAGSRNGVWRRTM